MIVTNLSVEIVKVKLRELGIIVIITKQSLGQWGRKASITASPSWSSLWSPWSSSWSSWSSSQTSRWASGARRHRSRPHQDLDHHSTFPLHHSPSSQRAHASNIARMEYVFCPRANSYEQNFNHHPLALATYSPHSSWQTACAYYAADCIFFGLALDVL